LLNTDQYGAVGKLKETQVLNAVSLLENILVQDGMTEDDKLKVLKSTLIKELLEMHKEETKAYSQAANLVDLLDREIKTIEDVAIFCITVRYVVVPTNRALEFVPSNDREFLP
jgi:hypothetical protein